jgi:putative sugar O-methyltransferase
VTKFLTYCITGYGGDCVLSREPTYGFDRWSEQSFASGGIFRPQPKPAPKRKLFSARRLAKLASGRRGMEQPFPELSDETRRLWEAWEKDFAPRAAEFVHPLWQKARPAFFSLFQNGLPADFLKHSEVAHQFCRGGFGPPQRHELNYLRTRPRALWDLVRCYTESPVGSPTKDCVELNISANSLGMLYYFSRVAEKTELAGLKTIVEFGGGYGCLCRVFRDLLPTPPTYIIIDLPEMLALQHYFLRASAPASRVIAHQGPPAFLEPGATHLLPVQHAKTLPVEPDLFISTFALSETPQKLQEEIAAKRFFNAKMLYLVGQDTGAAMWEHAALDSNEGLRAAARAQFQEVRLEPYHFASAWELLASAPKRPADKER